MKLAIMQPYFFPYIGYFQLINSVDEFVIYDNIQFTRKGWINRNRILLNGQDAYVSLPLKKDSDYLQVKERFLADTWDSERKKMLRRIEESYRKAPFFKETYGVIETCIMYEDSNLFNFILHSVKQIINHLNIKTALLISSTIPIDHQLKSEEKVMAICKCREADIYINPIGGLELYDKEHFKKNNLELQFQKANNIKYPQFKNEFVPWLSIIDVMMFNRTEEITSYLNDYSIV
ncbi:WbqC family protein [Akkermansiaceae bacterium]|nr:WbqC family protein [Akkermansiaceae bacterium]